MPKSPENFANFFFSQNWFTRVYEKIFTKKFACEKFLQKTSKPKIPGQTAINPQKLLNDTEEALSVASRTSSSTIQ